MSIGNLPQFLQPRLITGDQGPYNVQNAPHGWYGANAGYHWENSWKQPQAGLYETRYSPSQDPRSLDLNLSAMANVLVDMQDTDGDGKLNHQEFKQSWLTRNQVELISEKDTIEQERKQYFDLYDKNTNNYLDKSEMKALLLDRDSNRDGVMSQKEKVNFLASKVVSAKTKKELHADALDLIAMLGKLFQPGSVNPG